jgi:hypothetical protein
MMNSERCGRKQPWSVLRYGGTDEIHKTSARFSAVDEIQELPKMKCGTITTQP